MRAEVGDDGRARRRARNEAWFKAWNEGVDGVVEGVHSVLSVGTMCERKRLPMNKESRLGTEDRTHG